jgi:hypothetical protein
MLLMEDNEGQITKEVPSPRLDSTLVRENTAGREDGCFAQASIGP